MIGFFFRYHGKGLRGRILRVFNFSFGEVTVDSAFGAGFSDLVLGTGFPFFAMGCREGLTRGLGFFSFPEPGFFPFSLFGPPCVPPWALFPGQCLNFWGRFFPFKGGFVHLLKRFYFSFGAHNPGGNLREINTKQAVQ